MTIRIETPRNGKARYDILTLGPQGPVRERRNFPSSLKSPGARMRWAQRREAELTRNGPEVEEVPAPTLRDFGPRWMQEYARANGNKPSTLAAKDTILRLWLYPVLGSLRLSDIGDAQIQRLKLKLDGKAPKTKACVLSQLSTMLRTAERWGEVMKAPHVELPRVPDAGMAFYDFSEWEQLIEGARKAGPQVLCAILLGGDAGLRRGELLALEQNDVRGGAVVVARNEWNGKIGTPKGGKTRRVPMTERLREAVEGVRHLRGKRLLWQEDGTPVGVTTLQSWMETACRRAGLPESRNLHRLRHTFCSHLAMRGAPAKVVQELAGHADLKTTMRYMHLAQGSKEAAIALLETPRAQEAAS